MKVLERWQTPDGVDIVWVDWACNYPRIYLHGETIHAYPIARESAEGPFAPKRGERFLLQLNCGSDRNAKRVFEQLKSGELTLKGCEEYVANKEYIKLL